MTVSRRLVGTATPWLVGLGLGLAVVGPALAAGSLLNLDLVVTPDIPVPPGVWGLGPELPRRLPFFVPMAWLSTAIDGALVGKLVMVATIAAAFAGAYRLAQGASAPARAAAGVIYAAGPFLATRLAVGHFGTALAAAVLPWALPTLLRPSDDLRRTMLWSAAMGFAGINGGLLALVAVLVGVIAERGRRILSVAAAALIGQLPWLVPGAVVMAQGVSPAGAAAFDTQIDGVVGALRLIGGQGFWLPAFEVGDGNVAVPLIALGLLLLAIRGQRALPGGWGTRAMAAAVVGLVIAASSGVPLLDDLYRAIADTAVGLPLREGHRALPLFSIWLVQAAAAGVSRSGPQRDVRGLLLLSASVVLAGPALWGFGGRVVPVRLPAEWADARAEIRADPGPVLPLPWSQYIRPDVIDGRLVHHPSPYHLGADVLLPSGRGTQDVGVERADPRVSATRQAVSDLNAGAGTRRLTELGVRWIVAVKTDEAGIPDLDHEPDLERVVSGATLSLYRIRDAQPLAVDDLGRAVRLEPWAAPLATASGSNNPFTWNRAGDDGWMRGMHPAEVTDDGRLRFERSSGPIWYWPAALALAAHLVTTIAVFVGIHGLQRQTRWYFRPDDIADGEPAMGGEQ